MDLTLRAYESCVAAGKSTPQLRTAIACYRELFASLGKSIECAEDDDERSTLTTLLFWCDLQGEARVRREMERV